MKATFLSRFTPSLMKREDLEAIFVQREALAARILDLVRDSTLTSSKHHTLLIGPRGIGKTHLIALLYYRIHAMEDLSNRLRIAWLREEEWGVTSFLDFLLRIFRALQEEYNDKRLAEGVENLYNLPADEAERAATSLLQDFMGDCTLLVFVENLSDLFGELGDKGQKRLRAHLQEHPFWTIQATAQSLFNGVSLRTSPFYGFFRIHHLEELSRDEAVLLLTNIANYSGDDELAELIQTPKGRARIRAVHHLAEGNHRIYAIFSQFLTCESLDELVEPFVRTLDDLTLFYQERMARLSPQQRKIVEFLIDRRHAVPVKEIAQRCFLSQQIASSQLKILKDLGYARSLPVGREAYYEIREPLMRLCFEVKKLRGEPIRLFVDFLRLWYSPEELQQRLAFLKPEAVLVQEYPPQELRIAGGARELQQPTSLQPEAGFEREYLLHALREAEKETEDPRVAACLKDYETYLELKDFTHALEAAEELVAIRGSVDDWSRQGVCFAKLGQLDEALRSYDKAIGLDPDEALAWYNRGLALHGLGRLDEALRSFDKVIELDPNVALVWFNRGIVLHGLGRLDEELRSFDKAIELDPKDALAWINRGVVLGELKRLDESLRSFDKAIELDPNIATAWLNRGVVLGKLGRLDEALKSYDKAIKLGDKSYHVFLNRAEALLALNRWDEGCEALENALSRFAQADEPYTGNTGAMLRNLFTSTHDATTWKTRIATLLELYDKHRVTSVLGQGVVRSISALKSSMVSDEAAKKWLDVWQEQAGNREEFQLPLRLLDAAVRYRETKNRRILLELPIEERKILEEVLGLEETSKK